MSSGCLIERIMMGSTSDIVCIGIDQSYTETAVAVSKGMKVVHAEAVDFSSCKKKWEKRAAVSAVLIRLLDEYSPDAVVYERMRTFSQNNLGISYIRATGSLNGSIEDTVKSKFPSIPVYTVDTRAWKSAVVGSNKPAQNSYGVNENKFPTAEWAMQTQKHMKSSFIFEVKSKRKNKGTFMSKSGKKLHIDDNVCDAMAISQCLVRCDPVVLKPIE